MLIYLFQKIDFSNVEMPRGRGRKPDDKLDKTCTTTAECQPEISLLGRRPEMVCIESKCRPSCTEVNQPCQLPGPAGRSPRAEALTCRQSSADNQLFCGECSTTIDCATRFPNAASGSVTCDAGICKWDRSCSGPDKSQCNPTGQLGREGVCVEGKCLPACVTDSTGPPSCPKPGRGGRRGQTSNYMSLMGAAQEEQDDGNDDDNDRPITCQINNPAAQPYCGECSQVTDCYNKFPAEVRNDVRCHQGRCKQSCPSGDSRGCKKRVIPFTCSTQGNYCVSKHTFVFTSTLCFFGRQQKPYPLGFFSFTHDTKRIINH